MSDLEFPDEAELSAGSDPEELDLLVALDDLRKERDRLLATVRRLSENHDEAIITLKRAMKVLKR